ncbi:hypothetical protein HDU83_008317 [Entophlyctis luteolus]|nr:hypothetical protein HDU83_008317 [Entophlyctis luteolus]
MADIESLKQIKPTVGFSSETVVDPGLQKPLSSRPLTPESIARGNYASAQNAPIIGVTDPADQDPVLNSPYVRKQMSALKVHRPYFLWIVTAIQVIMLIVELIINYENTGSVIETKNFNYMIGPSTGVLIQTGARFTPCIRYVAEYDADGLVFECPDGVSSSTSTVSGGVTVETCTMEQICGMGGFNGQKPNQWFRFITPIFLHGGIIHLLMNLLFQCRTGFEMERDFGWWRMACIYLISGVGGFIFGGNYSGQSPSIGCSGALFGLIACLLIDLLQNWRLVKNPKWELAKLVFMIIISLLLGTIPYFDNFAHVGGFFTGFLAGLIFMPTIHYTKRDKLVKTTLLLVAVPVLILVYVLMLVGFYNAWNNCPWCKYLTCIPGEPWCDSKWNSTLIAS